MMVVVNGTLYWAISSKRNLKVKKNLLNMSFPDVELEK